MSDDGSGGPLPGAAAVVAYLEVELALEARDIAAADRVLDELLAADLPALHDRVLDEVGRRRDLPDWRSYE